jgi:hypothetical protein
VAKGAYVPTGGSRGRKPLDPAVRAARELEKTNHRAKTGGKRGRPSKRA